MNTLLIDTSKREALVALVRDGVIVAKQQWQADPKLGVQLLQEIDALLAAEHIDLKDIHRIAVHKGPGHFSALRTGIVTGTMLAEGIGAELVEVAGDLGEEIVREAAAGKSVETIGPNYLS